MNGYLQYNPSTSTHGKFIQSAITSIKGGKNSLADLLLTFQQMIIATGGDGSQDADYAIIQSAVAEIVARGADRRSWLAFCAGVKNAYRVRDVIRNQTGTKRQ